MTKHALSVKNKALLLGLLILTILLFAGCPMAPPEDPSGGLNYYTSPKQPSNLTSSNGELSKIVLTWDEVEQATSYQVWMIKSNDFGSSTSSRSTTKGYEGLQERGFKFVEDISKTKYEITSLPQGSSYLFSIVAMRDLGESVGSVSDRVLFSAPSALVEGSTVGTISLSAVASTKVITLYWDVPNIYKTLPNVTGTNEYLYDHSFTLMYKTHSSADETANWTSISDITNSFKYDLDIFVNNLQMNETYDFRIVMDVFDPQGQKITTVQSITLPVTTQRNAQPEPIEAISATSGTNALGVHLSWTAPKVPNGLSVTNVFEVQRSVATTPYDWTTILEASDNGEVSSGTGVREYVWTDTSAQANTSYVYRVLNGYLNDAGVVTKEDASDAIRISNVGWKVWTPTSVSGVFTKASGENPTSGTLAVEWDYLPSPDPSISWKLVVNKWNQNDNSSTDTFVDLVPTGTNTSTFGASHEVSVTDVTYVQSFQFSLQLLLNETVIATYPIVLGSDATLGKNTQTELITSLSATNGLVGTITLSWNVVDGLTKETFTIWQDGSKITDLPPITSNGNRRSVILPATGSHEYRIGVTGTYNGSDASYTSPLRATGSVLSSPLNLLATDGNDRSEIVVTWSMQDNLPTTVGVELEYAVHGSDTWKAVTGFPNNQAKVTYNAGTESAGEILDFRMRSYNTEQDTNGNHVYTAWTALEQGSLFGPGNMQLVASQGTNAAGVLLTWNAVPNASSYTVFRRFSKDSVFERIKGNVTASTYTDDAIDDVTSTTGNSQPLSSRYDYKVVPLLSGEDTNDPSQNGQVAQGWLFAPPANIKATKGNVVGKINVSWDAVAEADSYLLQRYTVDASTGTTTPYGSQVVCKTNSYADLLPVGNVYYTVKSRNLTTKLESVYQARFGESVNAFGETEADNMGYVLGTLGEINITEQIDTNNYYKPYVKVTWNKVPGANHYNFNVLGQEMLLDVTKLTYSTTETVNNGISSDMPGYLSYDPLALLYTYNDNTGVIKDRLDITSYKVSAVYKEDTASQVGTGFTENTTTVHRGLKPQEVVNVSNTVLKVLLKDANSSFGGDWWAHGSGVAGDQNSRTYSTDNAVVKNSHSSFWGTDQNAGTTTMTGYTQPVGPTDSQKNVSLTTTSAISTMASDGGGSGYLGADPLQTIVSGTVKMQIPGYVDYELSYQNISVTSIASGATYTVTVGTSSESVSDSNDIVRPF